MLTTVWGVARKGKIEPLGQFRIPDGTKVLLTVIPEEENEFWLKASESSLDEVWNNKEDNIYEQLLEK